MKYWDFMGEKSVISYCYSLWCSSVSSVQQHSAPSLSTHAAVGMFPDWQAIHTKGKTRQSSHQKDGRLRLFMGDFQTGDTNLVQIDNVYSTYIFRFRFICSPAEQKRKMNKNRSSLYCMYFLYLLFSVKFILCFFNKQIMNSHTSDK